MEKSKFRIEGGQHGVVLPKTNNLSMDVGINAWNKGLFLKSPKWIRNHTDEYNAQERYFFMALEMGPITNLSSTFWLVYLI